MDVNDCSEPWLKHCFELFFKVCSDHFALTYVHECIVSPPERLVLLKNLQAVFRGAHHNPLASYGPHTCESPIKVLFSGWGVSVMMQGDEVRCAESR